MRRRICQLAYWELNWDEYKYKCVPTQQLLLDSSWVSYSDNILVHILNALQQNFLKIDELKPFGLAINVENQEKYLTNCNKSSFTNSFTIETIENYTREAQNAPYQKNVV